MLAFQDLSNVRAGNAEVVDYANIFEVLLARAAREGISRDQIESARLALLEEPAGSRPAWYGSRPPRFSRWLMKFQAGCGSLGQL